MVLMRRKPIVYMPPPPNMGKDAAVWEIKETGETFIIYETYLERRQFYDQKVFTSEISGHSNMTFWEAKRAEEQGSKDVDDAFPEALRGPVLRKVQFQTISRIDELVSYLYKCFEHEIFPGEHALIHPDQPKKKEECIVRDKAIFTETPDRPQMIRYFVKVLRHDPIEACVNDVDIARPPRVFTKQVLRTFLKFSISRESFHGAPWIVKEELAREYNLPMQLPPELRADAIAADRKAQLAIKKRKLEHEAMPVFMDGNTMPATRPPPPLQVVPSQINHAPREFQIVHGKAAPSISAKATAQPRAQAGHFSEIHFTSPAPPPPPPPIKYPIEDLEVSPSHPPKSRPRLQYLQDMSPFVANEGLEGKSTVEMKSVGPLLETWNTLNVFGQHFKLDGFTLDDFIGALLITSEEIPCDLFAEIHCSVLKTLVSEQKELLAKTFLEIEDDDDDSASEEDSDASSHEVQEALTRTPRKAQVNGDAMDIDSNDGKPKGSKSHRAEDMLEEDEWIEHLAKRDFKSGGWALIIVGILDKLSRQPVFKAVCEKALRYLAPIDQDPSKETARRQYLSSDINLRVDVLQVLVMLAVETKPFKENMEVCIREATNTRKEKAAKQTEKRTLIKDLSSLENQRRLLQPDEMEVSPEPQTNGVSGSEGNSSSDEQARDDGDNSDKEASDTDASSEDSDLPSKMANRRISDRTAVLKQKREDAEKQQEMKKSESESKEAAEYAKVLKDIEAKKDEIKAAENDIIELEGDLRENSCHRTKVLGQDRYLNRYYFFERNAMSFEGDANSSTADSKYANALLWVQGPDKLETEGILELTSADDKQYRQTHGMSMAERRRKEEGPTQLHSADEWGYYDNADDLDQLMAWLEVKGEREKALRRELQMWRPRIEECMSNRSDYWKQAIEKHAALEERVTGIATRKRTNADVNNIKYPCTRWQNWIAQNEIGQNHIDGPVQRRSKKSEAKTRETSAVPEKRTTRQSARGDR